MPRKARIDAAGALHHIIVRGIERRKIFRNDTDRTDFLERLGRIVNDTRTQCFAWALIPNHAHMLLRTGDVPIATVMQRLLTGYAVSFNLKYNRHGQLFQNRYKSILCQEDIYLKELVRYIHLNPLRTSLVTDIKVLDKYPWCGHSAVMNTLKNDWQQIDFVLRIFSEKNQIARRQYRNFIQQGIAEGKRNDLTGGGLIRSAGGWSAVMSCRKSGIRLKGDERILGNSEFVEQVLEAADEIFERKYILKAQGYNFENVVSRAAELLAMEPEDVLRPGKQPRTVSARSLVCYWCNRELGMSTIEIANQLEIGQPAVSRSIMRGEQIAKDNNFKLLV